MVKEKKIEEKYIKNLWINICSKHIHMTHEP